MTIGKLNAAALDPFGGPCDFNELENQMNAARAKKLELQNALPNNKIQ